MSERERRIKDLVEGDAGLTPEEAELRLLDDDLWLVDPESRVGLEGEEAAIQWHNARAFIGGLINGLTEYFAADSQATIQALLDCEERCDIACKRAEEELERRRREDVGEQPES